MRPSKLSRSVFVLFLMLLTVFSVRGQENSPQIDATLQDQLLVDRDGDGRADAGDTLRYTLEITNCGIVPAENVQVTGQLDPNTQAVPNSVQVAVPQPATTCPPQASPTSSTPVTTPVGIAPAVQSSTPANGEAEVAPNASITLQFSRTVNVTGDWFQIVCSVSGIFNISSGNVTVTGDGINFTLDPNVDLQVGENCTVTVVAANVTDTDSDDPPDNMAADHVFSFSTETPPTVATTNPTNGATAVPNAADIVITFDEPVTLSAASFTLECPAGTPFAGGFAVSGSGTATATINPTGSLPSGANCQVAVIAANVSDVDANDPPDLLDGNGDNVEGDDYVFSFTTDADAAPTVQNITPANGALAVPTNTTLEMTFSESVNIASAAAFSLECPSSTPIGFTVTTPAVLPASAANYVITPAGALPDATTCTVTVFAAQAVDTDTDDPPDTMAADFISTFTTEAPPNVTTTNPANGASGIATGSNIVIDFNEPVDVTTSSFTIECPVGGTSYTYAISGSGTSSITLDPDTNLLANQTCTVTVIAAQVSDTDLIDPPQNMAANIVFSFGTVVDLAPLVDQPSIVPASTSTGANSASLDNPVSTAPTLTIPFSEAVDAAAGAFTLVCNAAPVTIGTSPALPALGQTSIAVSPTSVLAEGANCVLTVVATNISDGDGDDPPNEMVANFTLSFSVDTAPAEILTETEVGGVFQNVTGAGASNVDLDSNIQLVFNEAVSITFPANGLQCPAGNNIPVTVTTNNAATIVLNPDVTLPLNTSCALNIPAANISDVDTSDVPDTPLAAVAHSFTTVDDDAPTVTTNPAAGGGNVAVNSNITVTFNEPATLTGAWFDLTCSVSGNRVSTGELTGTGITIIENTPDLVYTIDPTVDLAAGDICTLTIDSANVVDNDPIDPPNELDGDFSVDVTDGDADDYVATFSTADTPPRVDTATSTPANGAVVPSNQVVTLNFTEMVDIAAGAISFICDASPVAFTPALPQSNVTTIALTPAAALPLGASCTLTLTSSLITDDDTVDPPHELDGNGSNDIVDGDADNFVLAFTVQPPAANNDAYTITPQFTYASGAAALSVRNNDVPAAVSITGFGATLGAANGTVPNGTNAVTASGAGGRVVMNADGTFVFYPDAGDTTAAGTATFFYTVTGGDTAEVTLTFDAQESVWFVDNTPAGTAVCTGTNEGTQACPTADLATVAALDTANDTIFVASGSYTCGITLAVNERLIGDGSSGSLQTRSGVTPVAGSNFDPYPTFSGTDPVLTSAAADCITLATGNTINGVTIGNTGLFAGIIGTSYGTATIGESTINGNGQILNLDTGTVNASFDSLSSSSSDNSFAALRVANSVVNLTSTGGTTISNPATGVEAILLISNSGAGFNLGATSVTKSTAGRGVVLGNGAIQSAPVTFASLAVSTSAGTALETNRQTGTVTVSTNTGSVSAVGGAAINVINAVGNTTPLALNLGALTANNSSLATSCLAGTSPAGLCVTGGTGTMTASSMTVTTGTNRYGVRINNSSAAFTFATVSISGMAGTSAETDTNVDGYPDTTTSDGDGVFLSSNTGSFTINGGTIQNTTSSGADNVDIRASSNVVINNTTLSNAGKSNVQAINMTGTGSFNNGTVTGAGVANTADAFYFRANTGTLTLFDMDNITCTMSAAINAEDCVEYTTEGTHTGTLDIDGDGLGALGNFRANQNVVEAIALGSSNLTLNMNDVQASPVGVGLGGMTLASASNATLIFRVQNNFFTNVASGLPATNDGIIRIIPQDAGSTLRGRFEGNSVDIAAGVSRSSVRVIPLNTLNVLELYINNNTLEASGTQPAILFRTDGTALNAPALSNAHIFMQGNSITSQGTDFNARGIEIQIRDQAGSNNIRFDIRNNNINTTGGSAATAIRIRMQSNAINTHTTVVNNTLNSGANPEFVADVTDAANNFCLTLSGHTAGEFNLSRVAGLFSFFNGGNAGAAITQAGTITAVGTSCILPISSGLVYEPGAGESIASVPLPQDDGALVLGLLGDALGFGAQPAYAQGGSFNIPLGPVNVGTIPAGSRVTVTFDVVVNAVIPSGTNQVSLQATISGSNFASVLSDDPATPVDRDATLTPLDSLQAVDGLPQTGESPWWQSFVIWGLRFAVFALVVIGLIALRRLALRRGRSVSISLK